ncbi:recombinase family protein [Bradyrhizobium sp.]|uniref:recombinase family protein n=1 Tax=Bradyrhizobium sp. TaxID=376 RepID=UPI0039C8B409
MRIRLALCEQIAARNGYKVIKLYSDRAKSGASMFERDGLLALMKATQDRQFDFVITESLPGSPAIKKIWPEFISGSNSGRSKSSTRTAK